MNRFRSLIWLVFLLGAGPAQAHAPIPGLKGFYIGMLHPFSTPPQALLMIGLGLMVGSFGAARAWPFLGAFLGVAIAGLFIGTAGVEFDWALYGVAVTACAQVALLPGRLMPLALGLTAVGALLIGFYSIPDEGAMRDRIITMTGSMVGANIGLLYLFGATHLIQQRYTWLWVGIAFRVAAAWLGAIALVMLALGFADIAAPV